MNQFYLFVSSSDSLEYFPDNKPCDFNVKLPQTLELTGTWTCSLRDIKCVTTSDKDLYVYSDFLQDSYVNNKKLPLLQYISGEQGKVVRNFDGSICPRLARRDLSSIHVYIRDSKMNSAPLTGERTTCTLHFEKSNEY